MAYVDGFVVPIPKKNLAAYRSMARKAGRIWVEHGALEYRECIGDDLNVKMGLPFTRLTRSKPGETVAFSWITYRSRAHRDRVNAKVMKDPRLAAMPKEMPFDMKRMAYGGFRTLVEVGRTSSATRRPRRPGRAQERPRAPEQQAPQPAPLH